MVRGSLCRQRVYPQSRKTDDGSDYIDKVLWILAGNSGHDRNKGSENHLASVMKTDVFCIALLFQIVL